MRNQTKNQLWVAGFILAFLACFVSGPLALTVGQETNRSLFIDVAYAAKNAHMDLSFEISRANKKARW